MSAFIGNALLVALAIWIVWRLLCWFEDTGERAGIPSGLTRALIALCLINR